MRGDVLFFKGHDFFGGAVAKLTGGVYCHTALDLGNGKMLEATLKGGVHVSDLEQPDARFRVLAVVQPEQAEHGVQWGLNHQGGVYNLLGYVSNVLRLVHIPVYIGSRNTFLCSELVALCLDQMGIDFDDFNENFSTVSPNSLYRFLCALKPTAMVTI